MMLANRLSQLEGVLLPALPAAVPANFGAGRATLG